MFSLSGVLVREVTRGSPGGEGSWLTHEWRNGTRALPSRICVGW